MAHKLLRRVQIVAASICLAAALMLSVEFAWGRGSVGVYCLLAGNGLGFESGPAVRIEADNRWHETAISLYGQNAWINKEGHESGNHYWYGGSIRQFVQEKIFIGAGYAWRGYETKGKNAYWKKTGENVTLSAGVMTDLWAAVVEYSFPDSLGTSAVSTTGKFFIMESINMHLRHVFARYKQSGKMELGQSIEIGVGYVFGIH